MCLVAALLVAGTSAIAFATRDHCVASHSPYAIGALAGVLAGAGVALSLGLRIPHLAVGVAVGLVFGVLVSLLGFVAGYHGCLF